MRHFVLLPPEDGGGYAGCLTAVRSSDALRELGIRQRIEVTYETGTNEGSLAYCIEYEPGRCPPGASPLIAQSDVTEFDFELDRGLDEDDLEIMSPDDILFVAANPHMDAIDPMWEDFVEQEYVSRAMLEDNGRAMLKKLVGGYGEAYLAGMTVKCEGARLSEARAPLPAGGELVLEVATSPADTIVFASLRYTDATLVEPVFAEIFDNEAHALEALVAEWHAHANPEPACYPSPTEALYDLAIPTALKDAIRGHLDARANWNFDHFAARQIGDHVQVVGLGTFLDDEVGNHRACAEAFVFDRKGQCLAQQDTICDLSQLPREVARLGVAMESAVLATAPVTRRVREVRER